MFRWLLLHLPFDIEVLYVSGRWRGLSCGEARHASVAELRQLAAVVDRHLVEPKLDACGSCNLL